jgi:hypothetical protein
MAGKSKDDKNAADRIRSISRHSLAYMLCAMSEMLRFYDFDPIDLTVEPDAIKQGVSRAALSRFLAMPIETVRRRANALKKKGVLRDTNGGLIVTEANQFKFGNNHVLQNTNVLLVRKFFRDLMEAGIDVPGGV